MYYLWYTEVDDPFTGKSYFPLGLYNGPPAAGTGIKYTKVDKTYATEFLKFVQGYAARAVVYMRRLLPEL